MSAEQTIKTTTSLTIYVEGEGVHPETMNGDEWMDLVREYQRALDEVIADMTGDKPKGIYYSVVGVRDNCVAIDLQLDDITWVGVQRTVEAIDAADYHRIPPKAMKHLDNIAKSVHKNKRSFSVADAGADGSTRKIIELYDPKQLPHEPMVITTSGEWSFAGRCTRINMDDGSATIKLANATKEGIAIKGITPAMAERLGKFLNKLVEFKGEATWSKPGWELESFRLKDFRRLVDNPANLFEELANLSNGALNKYDANEIQRELRGGPNE